MTWEVVSGVPPLEGRTCQVWWARAADQLSWHAGLLDDVERRRARSFRRPDDQARFTLGCAVLRLVLAAQLDVPPHRVPLDRTCPVCGAPHGRPQLPSGMPYLSVSHSGDRVVVACSSYAPVGVDTERIDPTLDVGAVAHVAFTPTEVAQLGHLDPDHQVAAFLTYWTRKEAVLKATGDGLTVPLTSLSVSGPGEPPRLLAFADRPHLQSSAAMADLHPGPGYVATLCILGDAPEEIRQLDARPLLR